MKRVVVIISTYNGSKSIEMQLDSIMNQIGVDVEIFIRDDNSTDNTVAIIEKYIKKNGSSKIKYCVGENEGYAKSFWDALNMVGEYDYYAFSDQDDVWKTDKLIKSILPMEFDMFTGPELSYCKMQRSDENLNRLKEQVQVMPPEVLSKKLVFTKTFNYGAATVINHKARELICRCWPDSDDLPHDMWAGLLCYWFGKVYYVDEELYYWIRHDTSVTGAGNKLSGYKYRLKKIIAGKSYLNLSKYLVDDYSDLHVPEDREFLEKIIDYPTNWKSKIYLLKDKEFKRDTLIGTMALKIDIITGKF